MSDPVVRAERPGEAAAITAIIARAFAGAAHSGGNEAAIVERLRGAGALTVSLVAVDDRRIVGHAAFSPVVLSDGSPGWFGLGPVAVDPAHQGRGIGARLIERGLQELCAAGAQGCVVLGDPGYYRRFGFRAGTGLRSPPFPAAYFQALALAGTVPEAEVRYHPAFG